LVKPLREAADIYGKLKPNELILTNLPKADVSEFADALSIHRYLQEKVHRDIELLDVQYHNSLTTDSLPQVTSGITLTLGSKKDVHLAKSALKKVWFADSLLKVRTAADAGAEDLSNRTVVIQNLPRYMTSNMVLDHFGQN
jgi:hypothetical protein